MLFFSSQALDILFATHFFFFLQTIDFFLSKFAFFNKLGKLVLSSGNLRVAAQYIIGNYTIQMQKFKNKTKQKTKNKKNNKQTNKKVN